MKSYLLTLLISLISIYSSSSQVNIIFDTDFGGDADDLGALAMLNHFQNKNECELLAVMSWSTEKYAVAAIDGVNTFYGNDGIPIGVRKDEIHETPWNYTKPIAKSFPNKKNYSNVPDAIKLYRKLLSESDDKSIIIVTVGPLKNIENLQNSEPDEISPLPGKELIKKKVKEFVIMGGKFPEGDWEWNFEGGMPGVTKRVIEDINVPVIYTGFELGVEIKTGEIFNKIEKDTPLYVGFMHFSQNAPWIKEYFKGKILDNSTFDQTAVLYAVRGGVGTIWDKIYGYCIPDENGGNTWKNDNNSQNAYLKLKTSKPSLEEMIEQIMLGEF